MTPRLTSAIVATVGALAFAGVATAHDDHQGAKGAKVYHATLVKTAAAGTAQLPDVKGKAQLVDGKKKNKISIHVRGLKPGDTYGWHVHKAANDTDDPCAPSALVVDGTTTYGDWQYGALTANEAGNASAKGTSVTFDSRADTGPFYVDVHLADGTVIACGLLKPNHKAKSHGKNSHAHKQIQGRDAQGEEHAHGPKPGHGPEDD